MCENTLKESELIDTPINYVLVLLINWRTGCYVIIDLVVHSSDSMDDLDK